MVIATVKYHDLGLKLSRKRGEWAMHNFHRHDSIELNLVAGGSLEMHLGGRRLTPRVGRLWVFWAAVPHRADMSPSLARRGLSAAAQDSGRCDFDTLSVPLRRFFEWGLPGGFVASLLRGQVMEADAADEGYDREAFARWHRLLERGQPAWEELVLREVRARLEQLALEGGADAVADTSLPPDDFAKLLAILDRRYRDPDLKVADVAEEAGFSEGHAMRLMRRSCGLTIGQYLAQLRVRHAQRLLLTTDRTVLDIAMDSGFNALSQCYRAFASTVGTSPGRYRRAAGGSARPVRG